MIFISSDYGKTYYLENKEKHLTRAREQHKAKCPDIHFNSMVETIERLDSGISDEGDFNMEIEKLERNPCFYILQLLTEPYGKSHRMISACVDKAGLIKKGFKKRECTKELNELYEAGFIYHAVRGDKKIYFLSREGENAINYMQSLLGDFKKPN